MWYFLKRDVRNYVGESSFRMWNQDSCLGHVMFASILQGKWIAESVNWLKGAWVPAAYLLLTLTPSALTNGVSLSSSFTSVLFVCGKFIANIYSSLIHQSLSLIADIGKCQRKALIWVIFEGNACYLPVLTNPRGSLSFTRTPLLQQPMQWGKSAKHSPLLLPSDLPFLLEGPP